VFSNPAAVFASFLFGAIGFAGFIYGKRMVLWKPMAIGTALMAYPYFVAETWLIYAIGCALSGALHFPRLSVTPATPRLLRNR
jgi:hypothetical protein